MKVCLVLQRRFGPVGHRIALILKQKYGVTNFCAYLYRRSNYEFLTTQKDLTYDALLLDEEVHERYKHEALDPAFLDTLEKEYGIPNLWPYLKVDRVIMHSMGMREYPYDNPLYSHEDMMRILQVKARAIINFLDTEKPDVVFFPVISATGNMLLYHIAKKKGIRVIVGAETRIGQGYIFSETYTGFSFAEERFRALESGASTSNKESEAIRYLETYRNNPSPYLYMMKQPLKVGRAKELRWFHPAHFFRSLAWFFKLTALFVTTPKKDHDAESPIGFLSDRIRRKVRSFVGFSDLYGTFDPHARYAFYPLHYEPEIATLLLSPFWTDQINLVRQIAQSLPIGFKLYVKDHPVMVGFRPRRYYKALKKIPNVVLLDPNVSSYTIIQNAQLITTISGTAGWEGIIFGKPVITFGNVYYNALPGVIKCVEIERLPHLVQQQLGSFVPHEKSLVNFVSALLEDSADVALHEIWEKGRDKKDEDERLNLFAELFVRKIDLKNTQ